MLDRPCINNCGRQSEVNAGTDDILQINDYCLHCAIEENLTIYEHLSPCCRANTSIDQHGDLYCKSCFKDAPLIL